MPTRLILVYNAPGTLLAKAKDALHKLVSPETYPCSLCAITYGAVSMRRAWRDTLAGLPVEPAIHHSDDFPTAFPEVRIDLPAILLAPPGGAPEVLIAAAELDRLADLDALIALLRERLAHRGVIPSSG